jgi:hypothetical protein
MLQTKLRKNDIWPILFGVRKLGDVNFVLYIKELYARMDKRL